MQKNLEQYEVIIMFRELVRKYEKNSIWISVLMLILAIFLIFAPIASAITAIYMFGIFILIDGIMHIVSYCKTKENLRLMNFEFAEGILSILSGILILLNAEYLIPFLPILLGTWFIVKSIIRMQIALNIRNDKESNWGLVLVLSIISLILGIFIVFNPILGYLTISIIGIFMVIYEVLNIIESIYILNKLK